MLNHRVENAKPSGLSFYVARRSMTGTSAPQGLCSLSLESAPMLNHRAENAKPSGLSFYVARRSMVSTSAPQGLCALSPESLAPGPPRAKE